MSKAMRRWSTRTLSRKNKAALEHWGKPGHLTEEQSAILKQLRESTKELVGRVDKSWTAARGGTRYIADEHLLRFLRARKFDYDKARMQLVESIEFQEQKVNPKLTASDCAGVLLMQEQGLIYRAGFDKEERPIVVCTLSQFFPSRVSAVEELIHFVAFYLNSLCAIAEKKGTLDFTCIVDMKHFSLSSNFSLSHVKALTKVLQDFYPERLGKCFLVHSPKALQGLYTMMRPLLDKRTIDKVKVLGEKIHTLQEVIDEDVLEEKFGGMHGPYPIPDEITNLLL